MPLPYTQHIGKKIRSPLGSTYTIVAVSDTNNSRDILWQNKPALVITNGAGKKKKLFISVLDACIFAIRQGRGPEDGGNAEQWVHAVLKDAGIRDVPGIHQTDTYYATVSRYLA